MQLKPEVKLNRCLRVTTCFLASGWRQFVLGKNSIAVVCTLDIALVNRHPHQMPVTLFVIDAIW